MAFFSANIKADDVKDRSGGSNFINKSGMYEIVLKHLYVDTTENGAEFLNMFIEHQGQEQTIYRAIFFRAANGEAGFGQELFRKLLVICGVTGDVVVNDPVSKMLPVGRDGEMVECMVLEEFDDTPMHIRIQMEYSMYEGKVRTNKRLWNVFRFEDKATASEILDEVEPGTQYAKEAKNCDKDSYKDGLTEEDVAEWRKNRSNTPKEPEGKRPAGGFGPKRFGKGK